MAAAAYAFMNSMQLLADKKQQWATSGEGGVGTQDTLCVGLISSTGNTYTRASGNYGYATVSQFLAGDGTHGALTEVSGGGYARTALTSITFTTSALVSTLNCATIQWTATANWGAIYAFFYDGSTSSSNDASSNELFAYWDFGGTVSVVNGGNFTLTINASGLMTFTAPA